MRKLFTILVAVLLTAGLFLPRQASAQSPEKMSYQAVIRDASDNLITDTELGMQISILQGTANGTAVYVETHTPTTNANGLVTVEIGTGPTSDDFSTIDWANGPYFIKTETDPAGGTSYTITGTSQLLSVPYALHAKTAENVTGGVTETDPVYSGSEAANITATDITNLGNLSGTNTGDQDGSETKVTAGTNVTVKGKGTDASPYLVNVSGATTYSVGDFAQGGIVFWVDETGQHGLVCAKEDQSTGVRWYAGTSGITRATGNGPFSGELNTSIIISSQVSLGDDGSDYAAQICNDLQITEGGKTYGDWNLPSREELNLMYQNKATIDATARANSGSGFTSAYYWSSTEYSFSIAWGQHFRSGSQLKDLKNSTSRVRAVRAF